MNQYSLHAPRSPGHPLNPIGIIFLLIFGAGFSCFLYYSSPFHLLLICVKCALLYAFVILKTKRRRAQMAEGFLGESHIKFAKSFDDPIIDIWLLWVVYEELRNWCWSGDQPFLLRATDRLIEDLCIDLEVVNWEDLADRTGRSLENVEQNPLYDKVVTVKDLVLFFSHQPMREDSSRDAGA